MDIEIVTDDEYGFASYTKLFEDIMSDIGKAALIDKARIVLKPEVPLFVFSIRMKAEPSSKKISDLASSRQEGPAVFITITDERYAPEILQRLTDRYGREEVDQQTRFELSIMSASEKEVRDMTVTSGEEAVREIIGALWRTMPEGMKVRQTFVTGQVITIVATEEIMQDSMLEEGKTIHREMGGI